MIKRNNTPNADIITDADVSRIHQVLSHLINSSIKFIKKEGTIPVDASKKEKRMAAAKMQLLSVSPRQVGN